MIIQTGNTGVILTPSDKQQLVISHFLTAAYKNTRAGSDKKEHKQIKHPLSSCCEKKKLKKAESLLAPIKLFNSFRVRSQLSPQSDGAKRA